MIFDSMVLIKDQSSFFGEILVNLLTHLLRYGIILVSAGVGCVINGGERSEGCSADTADRLSADLGTSTTDIFVQRSRTLK